MIYAMAMEPRPSKAECCFKNTVARQIEIIKTKDPALNSPYFFKRSLRQTAMCTQMELYTCMLGNTLVQVSAE